MKFTNFFLLFKLNYNLKKIVKIIFDRFQPCSIVMRPISTVCDRSVTIFDRGVIDYDRRKRLRTR